MQFRFLVLLHRCHTRKFLRRKSLFYKPINRSRLLFALELKVQYNQYIVLKFKNSGVCILNVDAFLYTDATQNISGTYCFYGQVWIGNWLEVTQRVHRRFYSTRFRLKVGLAVCRNSRRELFCQAPMVKIKSRKNARQAKRSRWRGAMQSSGTRHLSFSRFLPVGRVSTWPR